MSTMNKGILLNREGKNIGETDLPEIAFGIEPSQGVVHQYLELYLANQRQGTHKVKDRSEVRGGGRKPWRQKGTGRARVGTINSPIWRHGGVTFGPEPRSYRKSMPKKMKKLALASVLSARASEQRIYVFEDIDSKISKTKDLKKLIENIDLQAGKILLVTNAPEKSLVRAGKNIPGLKVSFTGELNTYDVLLADNILVTKGALPRIEELCTR